MPCGFTNKNKDINENAEEWIKSQYESIYKFLIKKENELALTRSKKSKGLYKRDDQGDYWWELRSCNYMDDFYKQKLVWTPVNSEYRFCIIPETTFINNSLFMITGNYIELLCALLNSKLYRLYFELLLSNGNYAYGSRDFFQNVPVIKESDYQYELISIVKNIYLGFTNIKESIAKIDKIVYLVYNLSDDEIKYIESRYD